MFARVHSNATHALPSNRQLKVNLVASGKVYKGCSILRSIKGVCEIVMHPVLTVLPGTTASKIAGTFAFRHQQKSGMLVKTTMRLRRLFVNNESSMSVREVANEMRSCHDALSTYQSTEMHGAAAGGGGRFWQAANESAYLRWAEWAVAYRQGKSPHMPKGATWPA